MMKSLALVISATACMTPADTTESALTSAVTTVDAGTEGMSTEGWNMNLSAEAKAAALWPSDVQTAQLIFRPGPDKLGNPASLVFVVWDHATVGQVYWVEVGNPEADMRTIWSTAVYDHTSNDPAHHDYWSLGNGGGDGGKPPVPHPNVTSFVVSPKWLSNARVAASAAYSFGEYAD